MIKTKQIMDNIDLVIENNSPVILKGVIKDIKKYQEIVLGISHYKIMLELSGKSYLDDIRQTNKCLVKLRNATRET